MITGRGCHRTVSGLEANRSSGTYHLFVLSRAGIASPIRHPNESSAEPPASATSRRSSKLKTAKSTDRTSLGTEVRSYEPADCTGDRRFPCPSGIGGAGRASGDSGMEPAISVRPPTTHKAHEKRQRAERNARGGQHDVRGAARRLPQTQDPKNDREDRDEAEEIGRHGEQPEDKRSDRITASRGAGWRVLRVAAETWPIRQCTRRACRRSDARFVDLAMGHGGDHSERRHDAENCLNHPTTESRPRHETRAVNRPRSRSEWGTWSGAHWCIGGRGISARRCGWRNPAATAQRVRCLV